MLGRLEAGSALGQGGAAGDDGAHPLDVTTHLRRGGGGDIGGKGRWW